MKAFLTGLGIGVGLGVLFAPDRGEATRKKLRDRVSEWSKIISEQADNLKTATARAGEGVSDPADRISDQASSLPAKKTVDRETVPSQNERINTMSREELMSVNGIGPVLADNIISGRPYSSRRELVERGILPQSTFDELQRELGRRREKSA